MAIRNGEQLLRSDQEPGQAEFMMGLAFAVAKSTNIEQHLHVQGMLAELIQYAEFCRACLRASEADAAPGPAGVMTPAAMPLWTVRMMFPKMFVRMCEIIQILGAGGLVAVPSYAELDGPAAADVATYFQAANADAATRIKLFRLAFDAAVSSFSGRQQLYERYYSGDPVRLAGTLYGLYNKETYTDRVVTMLDELEAHHPPPVEGEG
jgi:4-hydroxyphenylacetate 3-monooxygenase